MTIELSNPIARHDGEKITRVTIRALTLQELVEIGFAVRRPEFDDLSPAELLSGLTEKQWAVLRAYKEKYIVAPADFKLFEKNLSLADRQQLRDCQARMIVSALLPAWRMPTP